MNHANPAASASPLPSLAPVGAEAQDWSPVSLLRPTSHAAKAPLPPATVRFAKPSVHYDQHVQAALEALRQAATRHAGAIVQATSLGAEDMVITDLLRRHQLPIPVATLETGKLHAETLDLLQRTQTHYGFEIEVYRPDTQATDAFVREHGEEAMYRSVALRKACCGVRKLEPLARMLSARRAWVTGLRREQSGERQSAALLEQDAQGREKINPLIDWSWGDVWHYLATHAVPYNPLHDQFFPSIGCAPCTRAITLGEDFRAGRWWWEQDAAKECGLHPASPASSSTAASSTSTTSRAASGAAAHA